MVPEIFFESQKKILQSENAFSDNRKIYPQDTSTWEIKIHHTWNEVFEDNFYCTDASQILWKNKIQVAFWLSLLILIRILVNIW